MKFNLSILSASSVNQKTDFQSVKSCGEDIFATTGSTVNSTKAKMSKADLKESRRKAALRLAEKRRELHLLSLHESELKRQDCTLHRVKWRANAKGKRTEELDRQVDKFILRDVILNNPKALAFTDQHDFDCVTGKFDESVWGDLLTGLELHGESTEWDIDEEGIYPHISEHMLNSIGLPNGTKSLQRSLIDTDGEEFIRSPVARLFVEKTLLHSTTNKSVSNEKGLIFDIPRKNSIFTAENDEKEAMSFEDLGSACADDMLKVQKLRSAASLIGEESYMGITGNDRSYNQSSPGSNRSDGKKKLSLFAKFVPANKRRNTLDDRGGVNTDSRLGGMGSVGSSGIGMSNGDDSRISEDPYNGRLADSVFLVGPGHKDIEAQIEKFMADGGGDTFQTTSSKSYGSKGQEKPLSLFALASSSNLSPISTLDCNVEPKLLYLSSKDPEIEDEVLPFFCFPR